MLCILFYIFCVVYMYKGAVWKLLSLKIISLITSTSIIKSQYNFQKSFAHS